MCIGFPLIGWRRFLKLRQLIWPGASQTPPETHEAAETRPYGPPTHDTPSAAAPFANTRETAQQRRSTYTVAVHNTVVVQHGRSRIAIPGPTPLRQLVESCFILSRAAAQGQRGIVTVGWEQLVHLM